MSDGTTHAGSAVDAVAIATTRGLAVAVILIPTFAVILRFWARATRAIDSSITIPRFWWDDWVVLACLPFSVAQSVSVLAWTFSGFRLPSDSTIHYDLVPSMQLVYATAILYVLATSGSRLAAVLLYARIFTLTKKWFRIGCWTAGVAVALQTLLFICLGAFACRPVSCAWTPDAQAGECSCIDARAVLFATATVYVVLDVAILLLPVPLLWALHLKSGQKLLIGGLFLLGWADVVISLGKAISAYHVTSDLPSARLVEYFVPVLNWMLVQPAIALFNVCLPCVYALDKKRAFMAVAMGGGSAAASKGSSYNTSRSGSNSSSNSRERQRSAGSTPPYRSASGGSTSSSRRSTHKLRHDSSSFSATAAWVSMTMKELGTAGRGGGRWYGAHPGDESARSVNYSRPRPDLSRQNSV